MVRRFLTDPVDAVVVERIAAAAHRAPSAGFAQAVSIVVVTDAETRAAIAAIAGEGCWVERGHHPWLSPAPVHLVLCVEPDAYRRRYSRPDKDPETLRVPWWWVDAGAALMLVLQAAVDEGLAAGFLGGHALPGIHSLLGIPGSIEVVGVITVGHPAPGPGLERRRRLAAEMTHHERWGA